MLDAIFLLDKEGTAVIICENELVQKYKALAHGTTILESSLHTNLVEHLNSEIGLKTITNVETAKVWLRSSFLYQRMQSNPNFYSLDTHIGSDQKTYQENVDDIIMKSITRLKKSQLVDHVENGPNSGKLSATPFGEIMSKVCHSMRLMFFSCYFFLFTDVYTSRYSQFLIDFNVGSNLYLVLDGPYFSDAKGI